MIFNVIFNGANFAYPFLLWFYKDAYLVEILLFMALLWATKWFIGRKISDILLAMLFLALALIKSEFLIYLYPVIINLSFLAIFASSLNGEAIITKFAKISAKKQGKILDENALNYTRKLTILWCVFFVLNALVCVILASFSNKAAWTIYTGVISYVLIGILFFGEMIFRKVILCKRL